MKSTERTLQAREAGEIYSVVEIKELEGAQAERDGQKGIEVVEFPLEPLTVEDEFEGLDHFRPILLRVSELFDLLPLNESSYSVQSGSSQLEKEARGEAEGAESELSFEIGSWVVMEGSDRVDDMLHDLDRERGEGSEGR